MVAMAPTGMGVVGVTTRTPSSSGDDCDGSPIAAVVMTAAVPSVVVDVGTTGVGVGVSSCCCSKYTARKRIQDS